MSRQRSQESPASSLRLQQAFSSESSVVSVVEPSSPLHHEGGEASSRLHPLLLLVCAACSPKLSYQSRPRQSPTARSLLSSRETSSSNLTTTPSVASTHANEPRQLR